MGPVFQSRGGIRGSAPVGGKVLSLFTNSCLFRC